MQEHELVKNDPFLAESTLTVGNPFLNFCFKFLKGWNILILIREHDFPNDRSKVT